SNASNAAANGLPAVRSMIRPLLAAIGEMRPSAAGRSGVTWLWAPVFYQNPTVGQTFLSAGLARAAPDEAPDGVGRQECLPHGAGLELAVPSPVLCKLLKLRKAFPIMRTITVVRNRGTGRWVRLSAPNRM